MSLTTQYVPPIARPSASAAPTTSHDPIRRCGAGIVKLGAVSPPVVLTVCSWMERLPREVLPSKSSVLVVMRAADRAPEISLDDVSPCAWRNSRSFDSITDCCWALFCAKSVETYLPTARVVAPPSSRRRVSTSACRSAAVA